MSLNKKQVVAGIEEGLQTVRLAAELIAVTFPGPKEQQLLLARELEQVMVEGVRQYVIKLQKELGV